ncbi:MAG: hypothetical protein KDD66_04835 [Bdellovibrionales bacterium]|nr:hypothetical protein [Bdellovibrionales bacterium]
MLGRGSKKFSAFCAFGAISFAIACGGSSGGGSSENNLAAGEEPTLENVLKTNALIAFAAYQDSLITAQALQSALQVLVSNPSEATLAAAKNAWLTAREPYGQTEVYRFREGPIDQLQENGGGEGSINAWPLNEARIDYVMEVDGESGAGIPVSGISSNIIADTAAFPSITPQMLRDLNELDGDEGNVFSGYHAIEFLLWGQDLNADGTSGLAGRDNTPGHRSYTDYLPEDAGCTNGHCTRRGEYLLAAVQALIEDLSAVVAQWDPNTGPHYASFTAGGDASLTLILEGMGRLSFGELAGERINIALVTNSQEDEHSCFSDNTHRDILLNAKGVQNSFLGNYVRADNSVVSGAGIDDYLVAQGLGANAENLRAALQATADNMGRIDSRAKSGVPFDNQIQDGPTEPNITAAINSLIAQTQSIENVINALGLTAGELDQDTEEFQL